MGCRSQPPPGGAGAVSCYSYELLGSGVGIQDAQRKSHFEYFFYINIYF